MLFIYFLLLSLNVHKKELLNRFKIFPLIYVFSLFDRINKVLEILMNFPVDLGNNCCLTIPKKKGTRQLLQRYFSNIMKIRSVCVFFRDVHLELSVTISVY